jgi:hypothetical protein
LLVRLGTQIRAAIVRYTIRFSLLSERLLVIPPSHFHVLWSPGMKKHEGLFLPIPWRVDSNLFSRRRGRLLRVLYALFWILHAARFLMDSFAQHPLYCYPTQLRPAVSQCKRSTGDPRVDSTAIMEVIRD